MQFPRLIVEGSHVQHVAVEVPGFRWSTGGGLIFLESTTMTPFYWGWIFLTLQKYHSFLRLQSQSHICLIWDRWVVFNIKFLSFWTFNVWRFYTSPPVTSPLFNPNQKRWTQLNPLSCCCHKNLRNDVFFVPKLAQVLPKVSEFFSEDCPLAMAFRHVVALSLLNVAFSSDMEGFHGFEDGRIHLTSPKKQGAHKNPDGLKLHQWTLHWIFTVYDGCFFLWNLLCETML